MKKKEKEKRIEEERENRYLASSTQSSGFTSVGSSISFGGLTDGFTSCRREPLLASALLIRMRKVLSAFTMRVYTFETRSFLTEGGFVACFSSMRPLGLWWRKMKWT